MTEIGLIINPVAGLGGSVGLKGTDGMVGEALRRGAEPLSNARAGAALRELLPIQDDIIICTGSGELGARLAAELGFNKRVVYEAKGLSHAGAPFAPPFTAHVVNVKGAKAGCEVANGAPEDTSGIDNAVGDVQSGADAVQGYAAEISGKVSANGSALEEASGIDNAGGDVQSGADAVQGYAAEDTRALARALAARGVAIILFAGGDGTAADVYEAVGEKYPVLGIPAGVKIYSPVYATTPAAAGELALLYATGKRNKLVEAEVLDIDEERYRAGHVDVRLHGYLSVPEERRFIQGRKAPSLESEQAAADGIAAAVIRDMEPDVCYAIGAGTTTRRIMERLDLSNTLIGIDMICNGKLVANDVYGDHILDLAAGRKLKLVLTVTGGQGFLLGRGNQQLTPGVLRDVGKENIIVIATQMKLASLGGYPLRIDTGNAELDRSLSGYYKVITGFNRFVAAKAE